MNRYIPHRHLLITLQFLYYYLDNFSFEHSLPFLSLHSSGTYYPTASAVGQHPHSYSATVSVVLTLAVVGLAVSDRLAPA